MGDNQAINRVQVDSSKTRNRGAFSGSLAALVQISGRTGSENKNRFLGLLKPNKVRDFESLQRYDKKFYESVHELHSEQEICIREIF